MTPTITDRMTAIYAEADAPSRRRTITMTDRSPVAIVDSDWPIVAEAAVDDDHQRVNQWSQRSWVKVRRHADGRVLIYGRDSSKWQGTVNRAAGVLLPVEMTVPQIVIDTIREVCCELLFAEELARQCINDLPAEQI